jgi:hypothetical protein
MSGEDDKIKSALDIAMERANRLGGLSAEESRKLKEQELAATGEALAKRYLNGLPLRDLDAELAKHGEEDRGTVQQMVLSHLADAIDLVNADRSEKSLLAVGHLSGNKDAVEKVRAVLREHEEALAKARQENGGALAEAKRAELERLCISGSAVKPLTETSEEWQEVRSRIDAEYSARLDEARAGWRRA